jgi:hypothetical protein
MKNKKYNNISTIQYTNYRKREKIQQCLNISTIQYTNYRKREKNETYFCALNGETTNTNFTAVLLTRLRIKQTK